jgi:hypothetical protein
MTCTPAFAHAASTCCIISLRSGSSISGGSKTVSRTPTGSAPALARSFAVIWIASVPISCAVPVIGSVDITSVSSSASLTAAQSSPTPAPKTTSGLLVCICLNTERLSTFSGTFPIFIANSIPVYSYRLSLTRQPLFVSYNKLLTISTVISADVHLSVSDNCLFLCRLVLCRLFRCGCCRCSKLGNCGIDRSFITGRQRRTDCR